MRSMYWVAASLVVPLILGISSCTSGGSGTSGGSDAEKAAKAAIAEAEHDTEYPIDPADITDAVCTLIEVANNFAEHHNQNVMEKQQQQEQALEQKGVDPATAQRMARDATPGSGTKLANIVMTISRDTKAVCL